MHLCSCLLCAPGNLGILLCGMWAWHHPDLGTPSTVSKRGAGGRGEVCHLGSGWGLSEGEVHAEVGGGNRAGTGGPSLTWRRHTQTPTTNSLTNNTLYTDAGGWSGTMSQVRWSRGGGERGALCAPTPEALDLCCTNIPVSCQSLQAWPRAVAEWMRVGASGQGWPCPLEVLGLPGCWQPRAHALTMGHDRRTIGSGHCPPSLMR